eukprot:scaffold436_cov336-Pavlova_lutheri.AAC.27
MASSVLASMRLPIDRARSVRIRAPCPDPVHVAWRTGRGAAAWGHEGVPPWARRGRRGSVPGRVARGRGRAPRRTVGRVVDETMARRVGEGRNRGWMDARPNGWDRIRRGSRDVLESPRFRGDDEKRPSHRWEIRSKCGPSPRARGGGLDRPPDRIQEVREKEEENHGPRHPDVPPNQPHTLLDRPRDARATGADGEERTRL